MSLAGVRLVKRGRAATERSEPHACVAVLGVERPQHVRAEAHLVLTVLAAGAKAHDLLIPRLAQVPPPCQ